MAAPAGPDSVANRDAVRAAMAAAAADAGRPVADLSLLAVSKTCDAAAITPVLQAGHRDFAENRVQEAALKWPALKARFAGTRLHLIGPLQTNKVRSALALFDVIHTVDRPKLAARLAQDMAALGRRPDCLIQVNTGDEPQKAGVSPVDADDFIVQCRDGLGLPIIGLMGIPPVGEPPAPHFALLQMMARRHDLPALSMGMSADYPQAIRLGATMIRVGSAIFGPRPA